MDSAAPPSPSRSSPQLGRRRALLSTEVDWDWELPQTDWHNFSIHDLMRSTPVIDAPPAVARAPELATRRALLSTEVDWDWEQPQTDWHNFSVHDLMRSTPVIDAPPPIARAADYNHYANLLCEICGSGDREDVLLLCDGCERGHHTTCLRPIVAQVPVGPWFCPVCAPPPAEEPEINSFVRDEPKLIDVCEEISGISTPIVNTTIEASRERESGSSTIEKRNGKGQC